MKIHLDNAILSAMHTLWENETVYNIESGKLMQKSLLNLFDHLTKNNEALVYLDDTIDAQENIKIVNFIKNNPDTNLKDKISIGYSLEDDSCIFISMPIVDPMSDIVRVIFRFTDGSLFLSLKRNIVDDEIDEFLKVDIVDGSKNITDENVIDVQVNHKLAIEKLREFNNKLNEVKSIENNKVDFEYTFSDDHKSFFKIYKDNDVNELKISCYNDNDEMITINAITEWVELPKLFIFNFYERMATFTNILNDLYIHQFKEN